MRVASAEARIPSGPCDNGDPTVESEIAHHLPPAGTATNTTTDVPDLADSHELNGSTPTKFRRETPSSMELLPESHRA
jgi:hypothetical protein